MVGMVILVSTEETAPVVLLVIPVRLAEMAGMVPMDRMRFQAGLMVQMGPMRQMEKMQHSSSLNMGMMSGF